MHGSHVVAALPSCSGPMCSSMCKSQVLILCVNLMPLYHALLSCVGPTCWSHVLVPCVCPMRWSHALVPCVGAMRWSHSMVQWVGVVILVRNDIPYTVWHRYVRWVQGSSQSLVASLSFIFIFPWRRCLCGWVSIL